MQPNDEPKVRRTARVRRGLGRALMILIADLEVLRKEYRHHGMAKADLEDYELAVQWISQQSR